MKKGAIFGGIGAVILLLVIWVVIVAMGVGGEASKMDSMLKADVTKHATVDEVKQQLTQAGYAMQGDAPTIKATGPKHSLVVYSTYLTLDLGFGQDGTLTSYHLDRA
jgi:hypothetical protein